MNSPRDFYNREYRGAGYASAAAEDQHSFAGTLRAFIETHGLADGRCLEIGCGRGALQDVVRDYTGVDVADSVRACFHKPFYAASAISLPFGGDEFDAAWSYATLEHVPDPEKALAEMRRVLKPNGLLLLAPAWQCRPWAAQGYPVRPYRELPLAGKLVKFSIPLRDAMWFRALRVLPRRLARMIGWTFARRATEFRCRTLKPNYERYWMADADAVNSMDPFEALLWFVSRGDECLTFPGVWSSLRVRSGPLVFRIQKARRKG